LPGTVAAAGAGFDLFIVAMAILVLSLGCRPFSRP
jgi:hypothetical protein